MIFAPIILGTGGEKKEGGIPAGVKSFIPGPESELLKIRCHLRDHEKVHFYYFSSGSYNVVVLTTERFFKYENNKIVGEALLADVISAGYEDNGPFKWGKVKLKLSSRVEKFGISSGEVIKFFVTVINDLIAQRKQSYFDELFTEKMKVPTVGEKEKGVVSRKVMEVVNGGKGLLCVRCGRNTHQIEKCYAKTHFNGKLL